MFATADQTRLGLVRAKPREADCRATEADGRLIEGRCPMRFQSPRASTHRKPKANVLKVRPAFPFLILIPKFCLLGGEMWPGRACKESLGDGMAMRRCVLAREFYSSPVRAIEGLCGIVSKQFPIYEGTLLGHVLFSLVSLGLADCIADEIREPAEGSRTLVRTGAAGPTLTFECWPYC